MTEQQLRLAANAAWDERWRLAWDMNGDGAITISDAWLWLKWVFFAPGDLLLLILMKYAASVALFIEITPADLGGMASGTISALAWLWIVAAIKANREKGKRTN